LAFCIGFAHRPLGQSRQNTIGPARREPSIAGSGQARVAIGGLRLAGWESAGKEGDLAFRASRQLAAIMKA
jgi:hypothetical protein